MFQAFKCSSSGDSIVSNDIWDMSLYVSDLLVWFGWNVQTCIPDGHLHRVTYTRYHIDTIESPNDEHLNAGNM